MSLLLTLALLAQGTAAEDFQKIEAKIEATKVVLVRFTLSMDKKGSLPAGGTFSLDRNGRVKIEGEHRELEKTRPFKVTSDGNTITSSTDGAPVEFKTPAALQRNNFNLYVTRLGIYVGTIFEHSMRSASVKKGETEPWDLKKLFQVENLKDGGDGKDGARILTYELKPSAGGFPVTIGKIWYDPKSYRISRRETSIKDKPADGTFIEVYDEIELDGDRGGPPVTDAEMDTMFVKAKLQVARQHLQAGRKDKAAEILEDVIKSYPKNSGIAEARRMLEEARKK